MNRQRHLQRKLQGEDVQLVTITRKPLGLQQGIPGQLTERHSTCDENQSGPPMLASLPAYKCLSKALIQPDCSHEQRLVIYRLQHQYSRAPVTLCQLRSLILQLPPLHSLMPSYDPEVKGISNLSLQGLETSFARTFSLTRVSLLLLAKIRENIIPAAAPKSRKGSES